MSLEPSRSPLILTYEEKTTTIDKAERCLVSSGNSPGSVDVKDQWEQLSEFRSKIGHKRVMVILGGKAAALLRKPNHFAVLLLSAPLQEGRRRKRNKQKRRGNSPSHAQIQLSHIE
ncbi:hypothetical protein Bca4012_083513 [Brassica carinata]